MRSCVGPASEALREDRSEALVSSEEAAAIAAWRPSGEGGWRGVETPAREVARLAEPSLAGEVRALWGGRGTDP